MDEEVGEGRMARHVSLVARSGADLVVGADLTHFGEGTDQGKVGIGTLLREHGPGVAPALPGLGRLLDTDPVQAQSEGLA